MDRLIEVGHFGEGSSLALASETRPKCCGFPPIFPLIARFFWKPGNQRNPSTPIPRNCFRMFLWFPYRDHVARNMDACGFEEMGCTFPDLRLMILRFDSISSQLERLLENYNV